MYNLILVTNILRLLEEKGITKHELSRRSGVSVSFISELTHASANPSLKIMEAIAEALDTPLPTLLESTDLDWTTLQKVTGGTLPNSVPEGYERVTAVLPKYRAFLVKQWDEQTRLKLRGLPKSR